MGCIYRFEEGTAKATGRGPLGGGQGRSEATAGPRRAQSWESMEKMESPKGERAVKPVISYTSEKWVLNLMRL